jgi:hypothetical protein
MPSIEILVDAEAAHAAFRDVGRELARLGDRLPLELRAACERLASREAPCVEIADRTGGVLRIEPTAELVAMLDELKAAS